MGEKEVLGWKCTGRKMMRNGIVLQKKNTEWERRMEGKNIKSLE